MKTLQETISAGFLFLGSVILLCFGMSAGAGLLFGVGILLALVSCMLLIVPIFRGIYLTEEDVKAEGDDHKDA